MKVFTKMLGSVVGGLLLGFATVGTADAAAADVNYREIVNLAHGQCLDAPGGALNVQLKLAKCNGTDSQKWVFVPASAPNTYYFVNKRSRYCAEVNGGTSTPGERVDQWLCNGTTAEQWVQHLRPLAELVYQRFEHAGTGLCLDTVGGAGSQLMQWYCDPGNDAQTWLVR